MLKAFNTTRKSSPVRKLQNRLGPEWLKESSTSNNKNSSTENTKLMQSLKKDFSRMLTSFEKWTRNLKN